MKLSNFTEGKDNNFNLIRIVAALAVLVTHSFALAIGTGEAEPFRNTLGMTMGAIAVDVFFITSGFLVTGSLFTRQSAIEFIWARSLRIFPALLVMLILTVFVLGVYFTSLPVDSYLLNSMTHRYFLSCATLVAGITYNLPGVFEGNPYKNSVNGSLWTMPYEIKMYLILLGLWLFLRITKTQRLRFIKPIIIASASVAALLTFANHFSGQAENYFIKLFFMFFSGAAFYTLKDRLKLSRRIFWGFVAALAISSLLNKHLFFVVYMLTIAYVLFYIAYVPSGLVRHYNRVGDYSYGVYIYAFPVQQSIAALIPGVSVLMMMLTSTLATILLAALSWHILERRALGLKGVCVACTRSLLLHRRPSFNRG